MSQNLVSIVLTKEQQSTVMALLLQVTEMLAGLVSLEPEDRRTLTKGGAGSDRFIRIVLMALRQNPDIVPRNLDVDEAHRDLEALDMLAPIVATVQQLLVRLEDTRMALGSDVMVAANRGYALMQANGNVDGLEEVLSEASYRYAKRRRKAKAENEGGR